LYIASLRPAWAEAFLIILLRIVHTANLPLYKRLVALSYIVSFLARARFLSTKYVLKTTQYLVQFAHEHLQGAESCFALGEMRRPNVILFLAAVQAVCYVLCWHTTAMAQEILDSGQPALACLLPPVGTPVGPEAFTPLLVSPCRPITRIFFPIANMFLRVIRPHCPALAAQLRVQLPSAPHSGLGSFVKVDGADDEDESRITGLDGYFPFDPYRLRCSEMFVRDIYRVFDAAAIPEDEERDSDSCGFHGVGGSDAVPRGRVSSQYTDNDDESEDADFVMDNMGSVERGFLPSVGPSPAFRPLPGDIEMLSPLVTPLATPLLAATDAMAADEESLLLPEPSESATLSGNALLDRLCNTSPYQRGLQGYRQP
jgi:RNA polymerase I-specific transcription initiation factor RRN3